MNTLARLSTLLFLAIILVVVSSEASGGGRDKKPAIIPPDEKYKGLTYEDLEAMWWQAAFATPVVDGVHPLISGGAFGGHKQHGVLFLAGVFGSATLELTVTDGTALFFPLINTECSEFEPPPFHGDDEKSLRKQANHLIDNTSGIFAEIDGKPVRKIGTYRVQSDLFKWGPLPADNILAFSGLDAPKGTTSHSVDAGYYLLLAPLSLGEHVIHFGGTFGGDLSGSIDTTYIITVVKKKH
jgi:hypothetical protein